MRQIAADLRCSPATVHADLQREIAEVVPIRGIQDAAGKPVAGAGPGNRRALRHGVYSERDLEPRAVALRSDLAELVPGGTAADEAAVTLLGWQLARIEQANTYLAEKGIMDAKGRPRPILKMLSTWENSASRLCDQLGLTPTSRARLGVDLTRIKGGKALAEHIAKRYGADG